MDRIGKNNKEKNWEEVNMNNIAFYKRKNVLHFFLIYLNRTKMYAKTKCTKQCVRCCAEYKQEE